MTSESLDRFRRMHARTLARLYAQIRNERWRPADTDFFAAVYESVLSRFRSPLRASRREVDHYLRSLHVSDLALARACGGGSQTAWFHFVTHHRPALSDAILALTGDPERAREMADFFDTELHGVPREGESSRTLLQYYQGRSSLAAWLRAVVVRAYFRRQSSREAVAPDGENGDGAPAQAVGDEESPENVSSPDYESLSRNLLRLSPRDRLRLSLYHAQDLTLPQVARLLAESERKVLRCLRKTHSQMRKGAD